MMDDESGSVPTTRADEGTPERLRRRWHETIAAVPESVELIILVLGPSMDEEPLSDGGYLRQEIYKRCAEYGYTVKGELEELIDDARGEMGDDYDLCTHERILAEDLSDIVVIIPDSPGSFIEFGLFALNPGVCGKSVVLLDRNRDHDKGFVNLGAADAYSKRDASIHRIRYTEVARAWEIVEAEIKKRTVIKRGAAAS